MNRIEYGAFRRRRVAPTELHALEFDQFISSFNDSARVNDVYLAVSAKERAWLVHPEYGYQPQDLPRDHFLGSPGESAIDFWERCFDELSLSPDRTLAVDVTGMMRPHLLILPLLLQMRGFGRVTFLYSDPVTYSSGGSTSFTKGPVDEVRVIPGLSGSHTSGVDLRDVLIIGAGYDHDLVKAAAESKRFAEHYLMVGLPALQPHMYQESVYRIAKIGDSIRSPRTKSRLFAPANNPFVTAEVLRDHCARLRSAGELDNLYLCPVGPKTQVLGFALFHLYEELNNSTSVVFPYASGYSRETSQGITATHLFEVELKLPASS